MTTHVIHPTAAALNAQAARLDDILDEIQALSHTIESIPLGDLVPKDRRDEKITRERTLMKAADELTLVAAHLKRLYWEMREAA